MVREFKLPDVGEGVAEGELIEWLVAVGDAVAEDQPVAEVETDKALVEVPAPVTGTVRELRAEPGDVIPVGDVFITFDVEGEEPEPATAEGVDGAAGASPAGGGGDVDEDGDGVGAAPGADRVFATPSVRRLARELDVDLRDVDGSGPGGRVTEGDVRAVAEGAAPPGTAASERADADEGRAAAPGGEAGTTTDGADDARTAVRSRTLATPATRRLAEELGVDLDEVPATEERDGQAIVEADAVRAYAESRGAEGTPTGGEERIPYRGLRRTIGQRMERSAFSIPHVTHQELLDAQPLVETRETLKSHAEERGIRLTYLPFVMRAAAAALQEHPYLNATLDEEAGEIVLRDEYNFGFAVATDDGLFVPVVDDVDRKGLLQLASEINELAEKARDRSIAREEMQGGTFTVTNYGSVGGDFGTPIINHPEVAILGLGAIEKRPYVVEDAVVARETLPISLSIDHRLIDGAEAARFVAEFERYIAEPALLLLE